MGLRDDDFDDDDLDDDAADTLCDGCDERREDCTCDNGDADEDEDDGYDRGY